MSPERKAKLIEEIVARASAAAAPPEQAAPAQQALFPTAQELAQPIDADKIARELRDRIEKEVEALVFQIDVPDIRIYAEPKLGLREFSPQPSSDFSAVEQRVRSADLQTGEQETGAVLTPEEIDRPVAYLAGLLFDGMEELDAAEDKEMILRLVSAYLGATGKAESELPTLVYQYGDAMANDLARQLRDHLYDETVVTSEVRAGFVVFKSFSKSIRQKDGELDLREPPDRKSDIHRYLFGGIKNP